MYISPKDFEERTGSLDETAIWLADALKNSWAWKDFSMTTATTTTLALFIKHLFREFISSGRKDYSLTQVANIANDIAEQSGFGDYTDSGVYIRRDTNNFNLHI